MDKKYIAYWALTGLFSFALGAAGVMDLLAGPDIAAAMGVLGYPLYFARILGAWKVLGVLALLAPALPRLKEWAYAGFFFNLSGAFLSHGAVGDLGGGTPALVLLCVLVGSYILRPEARQLRG